MSGFKALNIESDDESDIEVDDTKEIQIEEALKLYQTALRYHAKGPASYGEAAEAYQQLFNSEIFKYPESQTELQRIELYGPAADDDSLWDDVLPGVGLVTAGLDTGPSTLPQILHLAHKNYAQFKLDSLSEKFDSFNVTLQQVFVDAKAALDHFVHALDNDDTDLELWRHTASVGQVLDSERIARFCLESVLEGDDEGLGSGFSLPGLEEGFAGDQLRELVARLMDQLSLLQAPLSTRKRRVLSKMLKQRLLPCAGILERKTDLRGPRKVLSSPREQHQRLTLKAPSTWAELGDTLLRQWKAEQYGASSRSPAVAIAFDTHGEAPPAAPLSPQAFKIPGSPRVIIPRLAGPTPQWPQSLAQQFPGGDGGKPTVQPQIAPADPTLQYLIMPSTPDTDIDMGESPTTPLPSRKRSGDVAGLADGTEEGRARSKRIRARDSTADTAAEKQALIDANTQWEYEQQLNEFQAADDWMYETIGNLFEKAAIIGFDAPRNVRHEMQSSSADGDTPPDPLGAMHALRHVREDFQTFLDKWSEQNRMSQLLLHGGENLDIGRGAGISKTGEMMSSGGGSRKQETRPRMPENGVRDLVDRINHGWLLTQEVAWQFIETMLRPQDNESTSNGYSDYMWAEDLKTMVVHILVQLDESIFNHALVELEYSAIERPATTINGFAALVQSIFELHLDIYCRIKEPNSIVEQETVTAQNDRLGRWSELSREVMHLRHSIQQLSSPLDDDLSLRFLWTTTFSISEAQDVSQDHVIECMHDLQAILTGAGDPTIYLQNNAVMPELSSAALEQELSRLTTKDFFLKVTNPDVSDPASVIESLEPLLEALGQSEGSMEDGSGPDIAAVLPPGISLELVRFLEASSISVRLLLWQRLRDAYIKIEYTPMTIRCLLRMMGMVLEELKSAEMSALPQSERLITSLKSMRLLMDLITKMYDAMQSHEDALSCMDEHYLRFAVENFSEILQLLQVFNVTEDPHRVGQSQPPMAANGWPAASYKSIMTLTHETQVRIWIMLYALLQECISQNQTAYPTPMEDRFDFLRTVHRSLGMRGICSSLNRAFIRLCKTEFFKMTHVEGYDSEQAQVLYDLHGINCFLNPAFELIDHKCTKDAALDKGVALQTVDLLLAQASKLPIKDLVKHSLKDTIDKVHGALARKKPTEAVLRNRETYRAFLKSAINPLDVFGCLKGEGSTLASVTIADGDGVLASKGWYFLMGHIALTKFRSQKRSGPTPTEDVDIAIAFFNQDLEVTMDHWETWFRLAQAYDTKIEESVVWSAEKLNGSMPELITLQRNAIHCYIMATALANRSADLQFETSAKMTDLYADFGLRVYSSSREPFGMKAFEVGDEEIFISRNFGVSKERPFQPLQEYTAWKVANTLFKRALPGRPDQWQLHYMIGKCLWKMHSASDAVRRNGQPPSGVQVLQAFVRALDLLPEKDRKETKDSKKEPVLEPHYKLATIVHKLFTRGSIDLNQAKEALEHTQYARNTDFPESRDDWKDFIVALMKRLRTADKSNWYHRMVIRHAEILYSEHEDTDGLNVLVRAAKVEMTQQMFTKTMVLQVWRPENERAGRHFVYTSRYTLFFVKLLKQLKDRTSLDLLARRVRRKPHDFFQHALVWQEMCNAYLYLMRSFANLPEGLETSTFSNIAHEDFIVRKEPLEKWMQKEANGENATLDVLREVQELKKINQSLMKPGAIDDLIGDAYAHLFMTKGKELFDKEEKERQEAEAAKLATQSSIITPPRNPAMSMNNLVINLDGANDQPSAPAAAASTTTATKDTDIAAPRRKIGVGRREIRTCAESCLPKSTTSKLPILPSNAPPLKSPAVRDLVDRNRAGASSGLTSMTTSAPGSILDEDESELSELEEEGIDGDDEGGVASTKEATPEVRQERRLTFPFLAKSSAEVRDEEVDGGEEADDGDDEDEDEGNGDGGEQDPEDEGADVEMNDEAE